MSVETLLLSDADVRQCIGMPEVLQQVEDVLCQLGLGRVAMPPKLALDMRPFGVDSGMTVMPVYIEKLGMCGIKWVGDFGYNPPHGLPFIMAIVVLTHPHTGETLAVMDGAWITAMRIGAAAAVTAKYLARDGAKVAALVGAGVQGRCVAAALDGLLKLDEVRVTDIVPAALARFIEDMTPKVGVNLVPCSTGREAIEGADIVIAITSGNEVVVRDSWVRPDAVVISMGTNPALEESLVLSATKIVVDNWGQASRRGEFGPLVARGLMNDKSLYSELGAIVAGKKAGREKGDGRIVAVPIGIGAEDIAVATAIYHRARELGLGQKFCFMP